MYLDESASASLDIHLDGRVEHVDFHQVILSDVDLAILEESLDKLCDRIEIRSLIYIIAVESVFL